MLWEVIRFGLDREVAVARFGRVDDVECVNLGVGVLRKCDRQRVNRKRRTVDGDQNL